MGTRRERDVSEEQQDLSEGVAAPSVAAVD